jgi:glycosyltransferase involved in cell wall biosynthesis
MHIGFNLIFLVRGETGGMEIYARELITALRRAEPDLKLTAFINRELQRAGDQHWLEGVATVPLPLKARNRFQWVLGEQFLLPPLAMRAGVDVLHSLSSTSPACGRFRRVVTILDLHYKLFPETHAGFRAYGMRLLVPLAARRAHRIIAISQNTAKDVTRFLNVPAKKIDVIPLGSGSPGTVEPLPEKDVRARFSLGARACLLTMAAKRPHKNLLRLLDALALIPRERRPILVMPGYPTAHEDELKRYAGKLNLESDVRFPGWVTAEEVEGLYATADAFIFPSLYEGFGLPVLEAMARGVPVACSNRGALPEVAGDAALIFDAEDTSTIAAAIEKMLFDDREAQRLRHAGKKRAASFSWDDNARQTISTYSKVLRHPVCEV